MRSASDLVVKKNSRPFSLVMLLSTILNTSQLTQIKTVKVIVKIKL